MSRLVHVLLLPAEAGTVLQEGRWEELTKTYGIRFDRAHYPGGKDHWHVAKVRSRRDVFAINSDGTGSHKSTGRRIPNDVADAMRQQFGGQIRIPSNNIIENLSADAATALFS